MQNEKEIRELLVNYLSTLPPFLPDNIEGCHSIMKRAFQVIKQALSLLDKPCKTCGERGEVRKKLGHLASNANLSIDKKIKCRACKGTGIQPTDKAFEEVLETDAMRTLKVISESNHPPQPTTEAGELKAELRRRHNAGKITGEDRFYLDILDLIEQQERNEKALNRQIEMMSKDLYTLRTQLKEITDHSCYVPDETGYLCPPAKEVLALRTQLEQRGEAIKWIIEEAERCNWLHIKPRVKKILGSDFDKIMEKK